MRLEYVLSWSLGIYRGTRDQRAEMVYLPAVSVNRYKTKRGIVRSDVKRWMGELTWAIRLMAAAENIEWKAPLYVKIDGEFKDKRSTPDLHNLSKVICDGIEEATEVNDRDYVVTCGKPQWGEVPKIIITVGMVK